jgi:glycolate oxidase subunit GlcD
VSTGSALERELRSIVGEDGVLPTDTRAYLADATESRSISGRADAVVLPSTAEQVRELVAWSDRAEVPLIPRGGGTGFAGGAVPVDGGVVVALERMTAIRAFDPGLWRMQVEAGVTTATVRRLARENGLVFAPDPGAGEQSQIGGNIATNAGGPHAFKYGVTGAWVSGLEVAVAPGELITLGGPIRKDVAGYDLLSLLVGSEGTLGIVTAAWLKLIPAPEAALPVVAFYDGIQAGCAAVEAVMASGLPAAVLEYLDAGALAAAGGSLAAGVPEGAAFAVISEADGSGAEATRVRAGLVEVLEPGSLGVHSPEGLREVAELWRWRDGVSIAVTAQRGGKVSEDIVVPVDRLRDAITGTLLIGKRHGLEACSWGHAGDGNIHSTFLIEPGSQAELERAEAAAGDLFALAVELGGSISGEHGIGLVKGGRLAGQWDPSAIAIHGRIKAALDPKNLMNPGKKLAGGPLQV